jgi:hypothetical protein
VLSAIVGAKYLRFSTAYKREVSAEHYHYLHLLSRYFRVLIYYQTGKKVVHLPYIVHSSSSFVNSANYDVLFLQISDGGPIFFCFLILVIVGTNQPQQLV